MVLLRAARPFNDVLDMTSECARRLESPQILRTSRHDMEDAGQSSKLNELEKKQRRVKQDRTKL